MGGLYQWDMETFRAINIGWRSELLDPIFWAFSYTGLGFMQVLFCFALYRWKSTRRFIVPGITTIAVTGLLFAQVIKKIVPRDRPSNLQLAIVQENFHSDSFVSGHTTTAFALATMISLMNMGTKRWWVGPIAFVWAFVVGISRIYRGVHWPTDTLAGACAGVLGSSVIYLIFANKGWLDLNLERAEKPPEAKST